MSLEVSSSSGSSKRRRRYLVERSSGWHCVRDGLSQVSTNFQNLFGFSRSDFAFDNNGVDLFIN